MIDILFNLDHPDGPPLEALEAQSDENILVDEDDEVPDDDEDAPDEQGIQEKLNLRTFVVASKSLLSQSNWVSVSEVFRTANDADILKKAGIKSGAVNFLQAICTSTTNRAGSDRIVALPNEGCRISASENSSRPARG